MKAAFCIKLIEPRAGDVISLKLAAKFSYKSIMLGKPQQNERSKGMCPRNNAIKGGITAPLLHHSYTTAWKGPRRCPEEMA